MNDIEKIEQILLNAGVYTTYGASKSAHDLAKEIAEALQERK